MQFSRRVNSVRPSVRRLFAALREQQAMTNCVMLAENATQDILYSHQAHAVPDTLYERVRHGYQLDQILKYL